ncbi:TspO/MBR family protein [Gottfriedia solisilvae]|uniref:TspO/MBR family protein n=1 Tax=Gottfriedia solisilvae TaxID=1516104 RepID=UPI001FD13F55|nr:tryptophan-rich sensory protein [Gottfriedia solisilvae]
MTYLLFLISAFLFPIDVAWYSKLKKPNWTPPSKLFGIVWGFLYFLIALSITIVESKVGILNTSSYFLLTWIINYLANQAFSFFQFKVKRLDLATIDCLVVALTGILLCFLTIPYSLLAALLLVPYVVWVIFATYLSYRIYRLNI